MAIVTDPDTLTRYMVVFGTASQKVSVYPVGDTQRGSTVTDAWVSGTGTIDRASGSWTTDSVAAGDVTAILDSEDAGHYFVNTSGATQLTLTEIVDGTAGAAATSLVVNDSTTFQSANINFTTDVITIAAHGYNTGHALVYDDGAGTAPTGLTDGDVVYVIWTSATEFQIATSYANALAGTNIDMSVGSMAGTAHVFHDRILVGTFNNGASTSEAIGGNDTSGDGDGDILDGVTLQCIYSYGKEEWRVDSLITDLSGSWNDDLIRHEFPIEAITAEQFEIGGGTSHDDWNWFNTYSEKKVRTGGWAAKTLFSTTNDLARQTGIITLGSIDTDAQVYYQQTSATTNPANFTFLGAINEPLQIYRDDNQDGTADDDFTTYLKLFVRKKARTYAQSEIADIGVTTIQTIVNRFPLAHATDSAITATDGDILGISPYRGTSQVTVADAIDGAKTAGGTTFDDADATWQTDGVVAGDTLRITSGTEQGYYTIASVDSEIQLTIKQDFELTASSGWASTESSLTYEIYTPIRNGVTKASGVHTNLTDGVATDVDGDTGSFASASATFNADSSPLFTVVAGDILWIQETGDPLWGLYEVNSVTNATTIVVKTPDHTFAGETALDYLIFAGGMYLEYRKTTVADPVASVTSIAFTNGTNVITITGGTFNASIGAGTILEVSSSENGGENDGSYTVLSRDSGTQVTLISTDTLVTNAADTTASISTFEGFKRTIGGTVYAYNWKVSGNGAGLSSIFQFIQHELRQTTDIDYGEGTARGDITDLLMSFASPTGTGINLYIDDLDANDTNNATFQDHSGTNRNFPFTAAGNLSFNPNLVDDANAKYWLFFTNDDTGDNLGRDYGTEYAIIVDDSTGTDITGNATTATVSFTYAYDTNTQRGSASAATDAPVTLVAIGLDTAQFVIATGTITRATGLTISAVAALERNYLNA